MSIRTTAVRFLNLCNEYDINREEALDREHPIRQLLANPFVLIERNVGGAAPAYWLSVHASPEAAAKAHYSQIAVVDWVIERLVDVLTGDEFEVTVNPVVRKVRKS